MLIVLFIFILLSIVSRLFITKYLYQGDIEDDGIVILKNILSDEDIKYCKYLIQLNEYKQLKHFLQQNKNVRHKLFGMLEKDYMFQDYIFVLKSSQIHTCHRDYNGTRFNTANGQKHKSYTILFYLEPMNSCLDVINGSHKSNKFSSSGVYLTDITKHVICNPGDAILFDANLIHTGSINNEHEKNTRV